MNRISFSGFRPKNEATSAVGRANRKRDTKPELMLRRALWKRGLRYRLHAVDLPGNPDIVFRGSHVAVFCDGDFWHGKDWGRRREKLKQGHNAPYWLSKIRRNIQRDKQVSASLRGRGWQVRRFWESDILADPDAVARSVHRTLETRNRLD